MAFNITPATLLSGASTINNLLSNITQADVVGVFDQSTMKQIAVDARPVKAFVREATQIMSYPVETGATISDHKIRLPTEIEFVCIIRSDVYSAAFQDFLNAQENATLLTIQTRMGSYRNMIIQDRPHIEDTDMYNAVTQQLRFREVQFVAPASIAVPSNLSNYSPRDPQNSIAVNRGLLAAITTSGSALSYFNAASVWGK